MGGRPDCQSARPLSSLNSGSGPASHAIRTWRSALFRPEIRRFSTPNPDVTWYGQAIGTEFDDCARRFDHSSLRIASFLPEGGEEGRSLNLRLKRPLALMLAAIFPLVPWQQPLRSLYSFVPAR